MKWQGILMLGVCPLLFAQAPELGLEEAVAAALAGQPMLKAAEEQSRASEAKVDQARFDRVGKLETYAFYTPNQKVMQADLLGISFDLNMQRKYAFQATFTQPLWTWGALSNAHASAKAMAQAGRQNLTRAQQQTAFGARQAYFLAAQASEAVAVTEQNLEQQKAFLETAKARVQSGAAARLDQLKAELAVSNAESDLLEARNRNRLAREVLATVTFDARFRDARLSHLDAGESPLPTEADAIELALKHRPDLATLRSQADALKLGAKAARGSGLPVLSFRASILQQDDRASNVFKSDSQVTSTDFLRNHQTYQVGLVLSWDPTGPFRARAKAAEISANERSVRHAEKASEEQASLEVRSALFNVREARERANVQAGAVAVAEEQARVARLAYREGLITSVELQGAELALTAARFNRLRARLDAAGALANLTLTLGE
jgi:HAE1 family hydrophobic/amphiphilic exporter-1